MAVKLELYRVFKEVAETGNISLAAKNLYISQSAVSQSVKQLETALQARLFARSPRGVTLTGEGRMLYQYVRSALGLLATGEDKLSQAQQLLLGTTHIYREVGRHLRELHHRKIMVAYTYGESRDIAEVIRSAFSSLPSGEVSIEAFCPPLMRQERTPETLRRAAFDTVRQLNGHTALVVPEGHIYALEIIRQLQCSRIRFPEDISLVIQGCETDWFLDSYQISCVYAEYRDQGMACIRELLRQLNNGRSEAGVRYTPAQYIMRQSTGPAPAAAPDIHPGK